MQLIKSIVLIVAVWAACGCTAESQSAPAEGCVVGSTVFAEGTPNTKGLTITQGNGGTCTVTSTAQCTYCVGPQQPVPAGPPECVNDTYATSPCLSVVGKSK